MIADDDHGQHSRVPGGRWSTVTGGGIMKKTPITTSAIMLNPNQASFSRVAPFPASHTHRSFAISSSVRCTVAFQFFQRRLPRLWRREATFRTFKHRMQRTISTKPCHKDERPGKRDDRLKRIDGRAGGRDARMLEHRPGLAGIGVPCPARARSPGQGRRGGKSVRSRSACMRCGRKPVEDVAADHAVLRRACRRPPIHK